MLPFHMAVAEREDIAFAVAFGENIVVHKEIAVVRRAACALFQKQRTARRIFRRINGQRIQFGIDAVRIVVARLFGGAAIDFHRSHVGEKRTAFDVENTFRRAWEILVADPSAVDATADRALRRKREIAAVVVGIHRDGQR